MKLTGSVPRLLSVVLFVTIFLVGQLATADTINWLDVSTVPGQANVVVNDPILGMVQITTNAPAQGTFSVAGGSLGGLSWSSFDYINYDSSGGSINGTMTFTFLDGPIDSSVTPLYFTSNGLASGSTFTIDNDPIYLGDIGVADGTGIQTPLGGGLLEIEGVGFNHNPDLFRFDAALISSISVQIDQIAGDGTGFTIGAVSVPEPGSFAIVCLLGLVGLRRSR